MTQYVVIVEAELRAGSVNYRIRHSDPLPRAEAEALFERVVRGEEPDLLNHRDKALLVRVSERQVCRFSSGITGAESMDRITLGEVV